MTPEDRAHRVGRRRSAARWPAAAGARADARGRRRSGRPRSSSGSASGGDAAVRELAEQLGEAAAERLRGRPGGDRGRAAACSSPRCARRLRVAAANVAAVARAELELLRAPATAELQQGQRVEVAQRTGGGGRRLRARRPGRLPVVGPDVLPPGQGGRASHGSRSRRRPAPAGRPSAAGARRLRPGRRRRGLRDRRRPGDRRARLRHREHRRGRRDRRPRQPLRHRGQAPGLRAGRHRRRSPGPSELLVVAGGTADPEWIALDLCAQAEHGEDSLLVVGLAGPGAARSGRRAARRAGGRAPERQRRAAGAGHGARPRALAQPRRRVRPRAPRARLHGRRRGGCPRARIAGCVFVGAAGATAFGDYAAGSNHVLPTGGAARFGGPLGPGAFMRRSVVVSVPSAAARELAPHVDAIAEREGFPVHGESATRGKEMSSGRSADDRAQHQGDADRRVARPRRGRGHALRPASASSTTCSTCSPATAGSGCGSRRAATSRPAPTTRSRTSASSSGRRSTRRSATAPGSAATATPLVPMDESLAECAIDISGRPYCRFDADLPPTSIAGFDTELAEEFFRAVANSAKLTLHVWVRSRHQRPPHDRGVLQGVRAGAARGRIRSTPRSEPGRALDEGRTLQAQ